MNAFQRTLAIVIMNCILTAMAHAHGGDPAKKAEFEQQYQAACGADVQSLCPGQTDKHAIHKCVRANQANLSQGCATFLADMKAKWKGHHEHSEPTPPPAQGQ
jgi:hypothetical protein